jgi:hypothetical protein
MARCGKAIEQALLPGTRMWCNNDVNAQQNIIPRNKEKSIDATELLRVSR